MAGPRPGDAVRLAGFRLGLQADHPGPALVSHPAAADHGYLHIHLRQCGQIAHRWPAAVPVLHVRHGGLELLCHLHHQDLRYFHHQQPVIRQGVFPTPGGAGFHPHFQPDRLCHPVRLFPGVHGLFCVARQCAAPQLVDAADAGVDLHHGRAGIGTSASSFPR